MLAVAAINGYQRHLSPRKGFRCAYRVLHGTESCSQYAKRVIGERGLWAGFFAVRLRFAECHAAAAVLRAEATDENNAPPRRRFFGNSWRDSVCDGFSDVTCCFGLEACGDLIGPGCEGACGGCSW